jgi:nucleotide-binding universal stress UspA family protein
LQDLVLGSIAHKLLEKLSFAPLMLVGKGAHTEKILVAMDGSENSGRLATFLATVLAGSTGKVRLFHVIRTQDKQYIEAMRIRMEGVFRDSEKQLLGSGLNPEQITTRIITGVPSRAGAIVEEARREAAGTIVVGRRGLSKVQEFFIGRVSNKVIHLAKDLAVWVVN